MSTFESKSCVEIVCLMLRPCSYGCLWCSLGLLPKVFHQVADLCLFSAATRRQANFCPAAGPFQYRSDRMHIKGNMCHFKLNNQSQNMTMVLGSRYHVPTAAPPSDHHHMLLCMYLHSSCSHWHATTAAPPSDLH